jgi:hypothetical protein
LPENVYKDNYKLILTFVLCIFYIVFINNQQMQQSNSADTEKLPDDDARASKHVGGVE